MKKTYIVIATNTNNVQRAFIKPSSQKANNLVSELLKGGWLDAYKLEVDSVMIDTVKLSINH